MFMIWLFKIKLSCYTIVGDPEIKKYDEVVVGKSLNTKKDA